MTEYEPVFFDIETTGFNPMAQSWHNESQYDAQVTAVAMGSCDGWLDAESHSECQYDIAVVSGPSEYMVLQKASDRVTDLAQGIEERGKEPFMVSFNGRQFDHPYLGARYARLRQNGYYFTHGAKRLDMMRALGKRFDGVGRHPSQDDCMEAVGVESEDPLDGADMPKAFGNGNFVKIESHAKADVEAMMRLFVETKQECLDEFSGHYDDVGEFNFVEEVDF